MGRRPRRRKDRSSTPRRRQESQTAEPSDGRGRVKPGTSAINGTAVVVTGPERGDLTRWSPVRLHDQVRFLAKVGGFVKRKNQPYADRGVVVTLSE